MTSTPMDLDPLEVPSPANGTPSTSLNITRTLGGSLASTVAVTDIIGIFRPTKLFQRNDIKDGRPQPHILSLDYDDPGELLMTSESDETIQIYKVREGRHDKQLLSKKYGVKLAKFTRNSSSIIYASTKQNDAIRYLTTHDNAFIRYFEGHEAAVTSLAMHPGTDDFISCSKDNTVRLWNAGTKNMTGLMHLNNPSLAAFDPSGQVFAVGSPSSGSVLLYDHRNFDKAPFATFDIVEACGAVDANYTMKSWTKLEFANDGRSILLGTKGGGHFLLDSFNGSLKAYLRKPEGTRINRLAAGEDASVNGGSNGTNVESSGDCCFTVDGRYVIGGTKKGVVVWDTVGLSDEKKICEPLHTIEDQREAAVVAFNPRFNFFATANQEVVFWIPDPHA
ncbi:WD repeat-containing protein [Xylariaceae sp. FL0016]|nr:WD repeat-containing protein [Xylariaceae sp. FL0016]